MGTSIFILRGALSLRPGLARNLPFGQMVVLYGRHNLDLLGQPAALLVLINFFVMLAMVSKLCDAVNSIPEKLPDQETGGPTFQTL